MPIKIITIDGPSGVGKGTLSLHLAKKLNFHLLDSGAIYRLLALGALQHNLELDNQEGLVVLAANLDVHFEQGDGKVKILLEGIDVTNEIKTEEVGGAASKIAVFPKVRESLLRRQRSFAKEPGLIADGRDMGTMIFPEAQIKIFLEANATVRAQRRFNELKNKGLDVNLDKILTEITVRDERDQNRAVAPLVPAQDAWVIDTSFLSIEEVVNQVFEKVMNTFS